jgi:hypothetical protein
MWVMASAGAARARGRVLRGAILVGLVVLGWSLTPMAWAARPSAAELAGVSAVEPAGATEATPLFLIGDRRVREASGIALSRRHRLLWVHNDAGSGPVVFGLKPTGATRVRVTVDGAASEDWEDIAIATVGGRDWVYLNDVGDAYQVRNALGRRYRRRFEVVRFAEPDSLPSDGDVRVYAEVFPVEFDGREGVNVESMAVLDSGAIILVEKLETPERPTRVWQIEHPVPNRRNVPAEVAQIAVTGASGANVSVDGAFLVVRHAGAALLYDLRRGVSEAFDAPVRRHVLPEQDQGEGVAFTMDGQGLILSSEGQSQSVWFVPLAADSIPAFGPLQVPDVSPREEVGDRGSALGRTISTWTFGARVARSLLVLIGVLALGFGVMTWSRRHAGRSGG